MSRRRDASSNLTNKGGFAIISAGRRSPANRERPTTGSDEGKPSRKEVWNSLPVLSNPKGAPTKPGEVHLERLPR